jgi:integrase
MAIVKGSLAIFGISHFTPHDLRRTVETQMAASGIFRLVIPKILNHVESGVTKVNDRHSYDKEKRVALEKLNKSFEKIIKVSS